MSVSAQADKVAKALAPAVREMLLEEIERVAAERMQQKPKKADAAIMEACAAVARAADKLASAKYTAREIHARRELEAAADALGRVMRKYGRMPGGA